MPMTDGFPSDTTPPYDGDVKLCQCGHPRGQHRGGDGCQASGCECWGFKIQTSEPGRG